MSDAEIPTTAPYRSFTPPPVDPSTVPYTGQARMVLTIHGGLANARLCVDPQARHLFRVEHEALRVVATDEEIRVELPKRGWRRLFSGADAAPVLVLHPGVAWRIQIRGGLANLRAELADGILAGLEITGGVSDVELELPRPTRTAPIRIRGGASCLRVRRPADVGVAVAVRGGISSLRLDDNQFGAIGGAVRLSTGAVGGAPHYALAVDGGASDIELAAWPA